MSASQAGRRRFEPGRPLHCRIARVRHSATEVIVVQIADRTIVNVGGKLPCHRKGKVWLLQAQYVGELIEGWDGAVEGVVGEVAEQHRAF
jgi:hypothetical protein